MTTKDRERALLRLESIARDCDIDERGEHNPLLESLNQAYNLGHGDGAISALAPFVALLDELEARRGDAHTSSYSRVGILRNDCYNQTAAKLRSLLPTPEHRDE